MKRNDGPIVQATESKLYKIYMKRVLSGSTALFCFIFCLGQKSFAGDRFVPWAVAVDSIPQKLMLKVRVTVQELEDGSFLDSTYVAVGSKHGFTNSKGYIEFDSVKAESMVALSKPGY